MNKDNTAATQLGTSAAKEHAEEVSQGSAVKLTSLAGSILNHKDDKKGQHDSLKDFFTLYIGYTIDFPDTSNTQYQSHCAAATNDRLVFVPGLKSFDSALPASIYKRGKDSRGGTTARGSALSNK